MIEMNPYYAKSSTIGPVFDVATFSPRKAFLGGVLLLVFGVACSVADVYLWNPKAVVKRPPDALKDLGREIRKLDRQYPMGMQAARCVLGFLGLAGILGGLACFRDSAKPDYYLRAGMGGLSLCVPHGISFQTFGFKSGVLRRDLRWEEIAQWKIEQNKRFGSISPNAGNLDAYLIFETIHGERHTISLDFFREPARIIWNRLHDAMETVSARLEPPPTDAVASPPTAADEKWQAIATALAKMLWRKEGAAVLSDAASGKFVQFAIHDGSLLLDLPEQALEESEYPLAAEYFAGYGETLQEYDLLDRPGGTAVETQRSFQLDLGDDVETAVRMALEVFSQVYGLDAGFELVVEEV